jgi:hypothetical protein
VVREADDMQPADPVAWLKAACNDARAKNRVADSLAGIFGLEPDGPPTLDIFPDDWRVESTTGAVAVGREGSCCPTAFALPVPYQFGPLLRFLSPLIEPDVRNSLYRPSVL